MAGIYRRFKKNLELMKLPRVIREAKIKNKIIVSLAKSNIFG